MRYFCVFKGGFLCSKTAIFESSIEQGSDGKDIPVVGPYVLFMDFSLFVLQTNTVIPFDFQEPGQMNLVREIRLPWRSIDSVTILYDSLDERERVEQEEAKIHAMHDGLGEDD